MNYGQRRDHPHEAALVERLGDYRRRIEAARGLLTAVDVGPEQIERAIDFLTLASPFDPRPTTVQGELSLTMLVGRVCFCCGFKVLVGSRDRGELAVLVARRCPTCGYGRSYEVELCGQRTAAGICLIAIPCSLPHEVLDAQQA